MKSSRKEEGKPFTKEAAMAKYYSSVIAQSVSGSAIEWAGGVGFTRETGIEKYWRDSKIVRPPTYPFCSYLLIDWCKGSHIRRDVKHPITDYCKIDTERI